MYSPIERSLRVLLKLYFNAGDALVLLFDLDQQYEAVVPKGVDWDQAVVLIVDWARRNGMTSELVRAAIVQKPKVKAALRLAAELDQYEQLERAASLAGAELYRLSGHDLQLQPPRVEGTGETSYVVSGRGVRLEHLSGC